ncbi:MAG: acyltransferase family protein [Ramlibacter sp.]
MTGPRVAGWDLLRGLCALTVASYHLLGWLQLAELPALGTYGVYLFFVLSGASLAYTHDGNSWPGARGYAEFLAARWFRLAPLYLLLCAVFVVMLSARSGVPVDRLGQRLLLNATFAFGLRDPVTWALLIGGWSLGIEFVFYLGFPLLARAAAAPVLRWPVLGLLALVQAGWIRQTIGVHGWPEGVVAYHQAPAFAAYFFAGCMVGSARRGQVARWPLGAAIAGWAALALLFALLMPHRAGDELLGVGGVVLACACIAVVWISGEARVRGRTAQGLAAIAGDITYGTYLLHPMLLFGLLWFVVPVATLSTAGRWAVLGGVLVGASALAWACERWIERPARRWGRALLRGDVRRDPGPQSEAASISS